jgi:hypothetical protein
MQSATCRTWCARVERFPEKQDALLRDLRELVGVRRVTVLVEPVPDIVAREEDDLVPPIVLRKEVGAFPLAPFRLPPNRTTHEYPTVDRSGNRPHRPQPKSCREQPGCERATLGAQWKQTGQVGPGGSASKAEGMVCEARTAHVQTRAMHRQPWVGELGCRDRMGLGASGGRGLGGTQGEGDVTTECPYLP